MTTKIIRWDRRDTGTYSPIRFLISSALLFPEHRHAPASESKKHGHRDARVQDAKEDQKLPGGVKCTIAELSVVLLKRLWGWSNKCGHVEPTSTVLQ